MNGEDLKFRELTEKLREKGYDPQKDLAIRCEDFIASGKPIEILMNQYRKDIYEMLEKEYEEREREFKDLTEKLTNLLKKVQSNIGDVE